MSLRTTACVAAAAVALVGAGCGGDDEDEPLTKEEFITQADQICTDGDDEVTAAAEDLTAGGQPSDEEVEQFVSDTVLPSIQEQADGIDELTPPEEDAEQIDGIVAALNEAIAAAEADPAVAIATDGNAFEEVNTLAQDYGLTACGEG